MAPPQNICKNRGVFPPPWGQNFFAYPARTVLPFERQAESRRVVFHIYVLKSIEKIKQFCAKAAPKSFTATSLGPNPRVNSAAKLT